MWLELLRSFQPNFTADAQELGMNNFPTCHPWVVSATGETSRPVSLEPLSREPHAAALLRSPCESVLSVVKLLKNKCSAYTSTHRWVITNLSLMMAVEQL